MFREADRAGLANPLESGSDVNAIAHEVAIGFLQHVTKMNADAEQDLPVGWQTSIAFDHPILDLDRTPNCIDHATELDQDAVPSPLHHTAVMGRDRRVDQVSSQGPQAGKRALFVGTGKARVARDIRRQNRCQLPFDALRCHAPPLAGAYISARSFGEFDYCWRQPTFRAPALCSGIFVI
jgi:hypothetical protein